MCCCDRWFSGTILGETVWCDLKLRFVFSCMPPPTGTSPPWAWSPRLSVLVSVSSGLTRGRWSLQLAERHESLNASESLPRRPVSPALHSLLTRGWEQSLYTNTLCVWFFPIFSQEPPVHTADILELNSSYLGLGGLCCSPVWGSECMSYQCPPTAWFVGSLTLDLWDESGIVQDVDLALGSLFRLISSPKP